MRKFALTAAALTAALTATAAHAADDVPGRVLLDARLRWEHVDQEPFARAADALTLRTRLGYETDAWNGFSALVEVEDVRALVEDYDSGRNGQKTYPGVSDQATTELNRAQIAWTAADETVEAVLGRQKIVLGNARFVGNSGWRQNERTFDAAAVTVAPAKGVKATYAYVDRVRNNASEWRSDSHLMHVEAERGALSGAAYVYALDFDNARAQSSITTGGKVGGEHALAGELALEWGVEYARQSEHGANPARFELDYAAASAGLARGKTKLSLNYERLDGDGAVGFQTPIASAHGWQGWSDAIGATPANGVRDWNVKAATAVKGPFGPVKLTAAAYDFAYARGGQDLGRELDLSATTPLTKRLSLEVKAAAFDGRTAAYRDRTKAWVSLTYKL